MAVGEAVPSDLSNPRLRNSAVHRAEVDSRHQNDGYASHDCLSEAFCHRALHTKVIR
jgi:hypothetical protein